MTSSILLFAGGLLSLDATAVLAVNLKLPMLMVNLFQRIPAEPGRRCPSGSATATSGVSASPGCSSPSSRWPSRWRGPGFTSLVAPRGGAVDLAGNGPAGRADHAAGPRPDAFIVHYLLVMSLALFKELRLVRWALLGEVAVCALLFLVLGRRYGMTGLLLANAVSLFTGSMWWGARHLSRLGGMRLGGIFAIVGRSLAIPGALLVVVAALYTPPSMFSGTLPLLAITAAWLLVAGVSFWFYSFNRGEREHLAKLVGQIFGRCASNACCMRVVTSHGRRAGNLLMFGREDARPPGAPSGRASVLASRKPDHRVAARRFSAPLPPHADVPDLTPIRRPAPADRAARLFNVLCGRALLGRRGCCGRCGAAVVAARGESSTSKP